MASRIKWNLVRQIFYAVLVGIILSILLRVAFYTRLDVSLDYLFTRVIPGIVDRPWVELVMTLLQVFLMGCLIVLGAFLYGIRCRYPRAYGLIEIAFGSFVIMLLSLPNKGDSLFNVFSGLAALYVIVRGFDNISRSLKGHEREAWLKYFGGI